MDLSFSVHKKVGWGKKYPSDLHTIFRYDLLSFKLLFSQEEKFKLLDLSSSSKGDQDSLKMVKTTQSP